MKRFDAVLFDCDGVLVDSEPITNGVLRQMLNEAGWALTPAECEHHFIGRAVRDQVEVGAGLGVLREDLEEAGDDFSRAYYRTWNRNNLGLSLDLSIPQGRGVVHRLVEISEAGVENCSPRVMANSRAMVLR